MSLLLATQITAIATAVLAVGAIVTAIFAVLALRKEAEEVRAIEEQVTDQQELTRQQAGLLKLQSEQLELQRQQLDDQRKTNEKHSSVLELEAAELTEALKQRQHDAGEQRRKQAARVTAWLSWEEGWGWGALVRNASDEPVFDVRVFFHHMREKEGGGYQAVSQGGPPPRETTAVLPPGEDRFVAIPAAVRAMFGSITIDDRTCAASVEFTDAAGNRWERDPRGALVPRS